VAGCDDSLAGDAPCRRSVDARGGAAVGDRGAYPWFTRRCYPPGIAAPRTRRTPMPDQDTPPPPDAVVRQALHALIERLTPEARLALLRLVQDWVTPPRQPPAAP